MASSSFLHYFFLTVAVSWCAGLVQILAYYGLTYKLLPYNKLKVEGSAPTARDMRRDAYLTCVATFIQGAFGVLSYVLWTGRFGRFYTFPQEYGWAYLAFSVVLLFVLYDGYFYLVHRILHATRWGRIVHGAHHKTRSPTPFSAMSIHPVETLILGLYGLVMPFVIPLHMWALTIFLAGSFSFSIYVHSGVELIPRSWRAKWFERFLYTTSRHSNHHRTPHEDYGLYTVFWDRLFKTASNRVGNLSGTSSTSRKQAS